MGGCHPFDYDYEDQCSCCEKKHYVTIIGSNNMQTCQKDADEKCKCVYCLHNRIETIEDYVDMEDKITASSVLIRINLIEKEVNDLKQKDKHVCVSHYAEIMEDINRIEKVISIDKKPHKCPVCNGRGDIRNGVPFSMPPKWPDCKSCQGNGIVWG